MGAGKGKAKRARSQQSGQLVGVDEPYGSLSSAWLESHIEENGPYAYHILHRRNIEAVLRDGLIPTDLLPDAGGNQEPGMDPRPGHVYIGIDAQWLLEWGQEMLQADLDDITMVKIDLREIDVRRIVADEDVFVIMDEDPSPWGLPAWRDQVGPGKKYASTGEWAEAIRLGEQPGVTEFSAKVTGRLAVRGAIDPAAIEEDPLPTQEEEDLRAEEWIAQQSK